jgi:anti-sigma B factor antagonist
VQAEPDFSVTSHRVGETVVVTPEGEIDLATADRLEAALAAAREQASTVVLDLRAVSFIDSAGLRLVIASSRAAAAGGAEFAVVRGPAEVERVFDLVGLDSRVTMLDRPPAG